MVILKAKFSSSGSLLVGQGDPHWTLGPRDIYIYIYKPYTGCDVNVMIHYVPM